MNRTPLTTEFLTTRYVRDGATFGELAAETGWSSTKIRNAMHDAELPIRPRGGVTLSGALTADYLAQRYTTDAASVVDIAAETGLSAATVLRAMRRGRVATDVAHRRGSRYASVLTRDFLIGLYMFDGSSAAAIASEVGCSTQTVLTALRNHGLTVRVQKAPPIAREQLLDLYITQGHAAGFVANALGVSRGTLNAALIREHLPTPRQMRQALGDTGLTVAAAYQALATYVPTDEPGTCVLAAAWALAAR